ncbi:single-stranded-DNA-specific exonuclease RecJ [Candidatus Gracilibacteria bacterium]|nr:single-stranded-DNA-specific exonuclease RecJ [Candidatus Gracilibacteria bacterium]MCF7856652.1 single-stranded-DNA-specific exonuclease RecJ [Candidatus Gracilibacteria bacterium]MCF7896969.1 single-stranded-DNA-specific exonuclease RecJ [Candidatus Gracilibacteria bacterium]
MDNLSFLGKQWLPPRAQNFGELRKLRGIEAAEFHPPEKLKDLSKAVERIRAAVKNQEPILIIGDYDADGICASAILFKVLQQLGALVSVRLPHRMKHGYGLNAEFVEEAQKLGVKLIITVDNGIAARQEVELANSFGIDVIVTDHHLPPEILPPALAILNPRQKDCNYPEKNLSGAAVAYKLATVLLNQELRTKNQELTDEILVLATIGTIADVCDLTGENRRIVTDGLLKIPLTQNLGLRKILENSGLGEKISTEDVGFRIAPRLNAAGRLGDPLIAFQALVNGRGDEFADHLESLNLERRSLTMKILDEVEERLGEIGGEKILVAGGENFHPGIVGLIAGKLAEKYFRPAIVMSSQDGKLVGSCRSPLLEFDITAALQNSEQFLEKFGGHRAAAGFTLLEKNRAAFEKSLADYAESKITAVELIPRIEIDLSVTEMDLTKDFLTKLESFAPFGTGNLEPLLFLPAAKIMEIRKVGSDEKHLRVKIGQRKLTAIGFGLGEFAEQLERQKNADLVFQFSENVWNGRRELQLKIVDLR